MNDDKLIRNVQLHLSMRNEVTVSLEAVENEARLRSRLEALGLSLTLDATIEQYIVRKA